MDEDANANAQGTQPNPAPEASGAANDTNPSTATTTEATDAKEQGQKADPQAGVSFDPEIQKFLDNQNIKTDDLKAAVTELAKRNMKMRGHQNEPSVAEVLGKKEEPKVENPIAKAMEQNQPATPPQSAPQPQQTSQPRVPSDMDIANVSMFVKQQYPDVTTDAKFYQSMINDGFKPVTADGQINLKSVLSYGIVRVMTIEPPASTTVDRIIDTAPEIVDKITAIVDKKKAEKAEKAEKEAAEEALPEVPAE